MVDRAHREVSRFILRSGSTANHFDSVHAWIHRLLLEVRCLRFFFASFRFPIYRFGRFFDQTVIDFDRFVVDLDRSVIDLDRFVVDLDRLVIDLDRPDLSLRRPLTFVDRSVIDVDRRGFFLSRTCCESTGNVFRLEDRRSWFRRCGTRFYP